MAFKSAELKRLYEEMRSLGYPIDAALAGRLFRNDTLERLVRRFRARVAKIRGTGIQITAIERILAAQVLAPAWVAFYERRLNDLYIDLAALAPTPDERERWLSLPSSQPS